MATLIRDGKGSRCSSACYNASDDKCVCTCCGGANHGVGYAKAAENCRELAIKLGGRRSKKARRRAANIVTQERLFD